MAARQRRPATEAADSPRPEAITAADQPRDIAGLPELTGETIYEHFADFAAGIRDSGYKMLPSRTQYIEYLRNMGYTVSRSQLYRLCNAQYPSCHAVVSEIIADTVIEGAAIGRYTAQAAIFALRNWCNWTDKQIIDISQQIHITMDGATDSLTV